MSPFGIQDEPFQWELSGYIMESMTLEHSGYLVRNVPCTLHAKTTFVYFEKE